MNYIKKKIVIGLELACELTRHRWCFKLAGLSAKLDHRWKTGHWFEVKDKNNANEN
jgi:hypothetical protein